MVACSIRLNLPEGRLHITQVYTTYLQWFGVWYGMICDNDCFTHINLDHYFGTIFFWDVPIPLQKGGSQFFVKSMDEAVRFGGRARWWIPVLLEIPYDTSDILYKYISGWWFQPLWKILVRLDHHPKLLGKIKNVPNHQPDIYIYIYKLSIII